MRLVLDWAVHRGKFIFGSSTPDLTQCFECFYSAPTLGSSVPFPLNC